MEQIAVSGVKYNAENKTTQNVLGVASRLSPGETRDIPGMFNGFALRRAGLRLSGIRGALWSLARSSSAGAGLYLYPSLASTCFVLLSAYEGLS